MFIRQYHVFFKMKHSAQLKREFTISAQLEDKSSEVQRSKVS